MTTETKKQTKEGWGRPWGVWSRHYFRNRKSLCGHISCFDGDLSSDNESDDNCLTCKRLLLKPVGTS